MIKSICILGGGTSGVVTALVLKQWYPTMDITIVESSSVGIVGVGEGSTEHWKHFMQATQIDLKELITETGATFKSGIRFENWNGDGKSFMHALHGSYTDVIHNGMPAVMLDLMNRGAEHLTPISIVNSIHYAPVDTSVNQYHFDTHKLNIFLHKKCVERGVKTVDADIVDVILDEQGFVKSLVGTDNVQYTAELFVDCSGFAKIISSKLGSKWVDCGEYLPMNRAIAFPTPGEVDIPSHTLSRALSSGWQWRIPTQDRYGNGYVYSSDFISDDAAIAEIQELYPDDIQVAKSFKFSAGYINKFWIKNCVSIGLSGSFVEPLEASSIGTSIQQAFALGSSILSWSRGDDTIAKQYNKHFEIVAKNIIDFVQLHYVTKRDDSEFWRSCKDIKLTDFNKEMLPHFKHNLPSRAFFNSPFLLFTEQNWIQVMYGLGIFDTGSMSKLWNDQDPGLHVETQRIISSVDQFLASNVGFKHRDALNHIMSLNFK